MRENMVGGRDVKDSRTAEACLTSKKHQETIACCKLNKKITE